MLARALGHDPRIGSAWLQPGLGFGGGCLPKDIRAFGKRAAELGVAEAATLLRAVDAINTGRRDRMVELARELAGGHLADARVGVLGLALKPETDDIRDSPAMAVAAELARAGAAVTAYDPAAMDRARQKCPQLGYAATALDAARGADVLLILTEWPEFTAADPDEFGAVAGRRVVADGRHALDPRTWVAAGWTYRALGRPESATATTGPPALSGT